MLMTKIIPIEEADFTSWLKYTLTKSLLATDTWETNGAVYIPVSEIPSNYIERVHGGYFTFKNTYMKYLDDLRYTVTSKLDKYIILTFSQHNSFSYEIRLLGEKEVIITLFNNAIREHMGSESREKHELILAEDELLPVNKDEKFRTSYGYISMEHALLVIEYINKYSNWNIKLPTETNNFMQVRW